MIRTFATTTDNDRVHMENTNGHSTGTVIARREGHVVVLWDGLAGQMTYTERDATELGLVFVSA